MFSLLTFFEKYSKKIFNNRPLSTMAQFYQHADTNFAKWTSIAINKKMIADSILTKELDLLTNSDLFSLKLAENSDGINLQLWQNQHSVCKIKTDRNSDLLLKFNQLIDKLIETEMSHFQYVLNSPKENLNYTPSEISEGEKALEWIRVSFKVLENAVIESITNTDYLFQILLFLGSNPKTTTHEIRLVAFNLDIKFELLQNGLLRVKIYNDKDGAFGSNKIASLEGDYKFRNREMLDELTKLISVVAPGIKC